MKQNFNRAFACLLFLASSTAAIAFSGPFLETGSLRLPADSTPTCAIESARDTLYVSCRDAKVILEVDPVKQSVVRSLSLDKSPSLLCEDSSRNILYVSNASDQNLEVVDLRRWRVIRSIALQKGSVLGAVAIVPKSPLMIVSDAIRPIIYVLDLRSDRCVRVLGTPGIVSRIIVGDHGEVMASTYGEDFFAGQDSPAAYHSLKGALLRIDPIRFRVAVLHVFSGDSVLAFTMAGQNGAVYAATFEAPSIVRVGAGSANAKVERIMDRPSYDVLYDGATRYLIESSFDNTVRIIDPVSMDVVAATIGDKGSLLVFRSKRPPEVIACVTSYSGSSITFVKLPARVVHSASPI